MQSKADIRKVILERRARIAQGERKRFEERIIENIRSLPEYRKANTIALYFPVRGEVDLLDLVYADRKVAVFPKVERGGLTFYPVKNPDDFVTGSFGIPEPSGGRAVAARDIDLIIVPGICFDDCCHRLGYGKGYYDRLLKANPDVYTIGVCFDECFVRHLPVEPWDVNVHCVVTQTGFFRSKCEVQ
jgi:5-formyltetrahydrofolate cyclo-ligase